MWSPLERVSEGVYQAQIIRMDEPSPRTHRIYPKDEIVACLMRTSLGPDWIGQLGERHNGEISLSRVSHTLISLGMEGDFLVGQIKLLKTPLGIILHELLEQEAQMGLNILIQGQVDENMVVRDIDILGCDVQTFPSK